MLRVCNRYIYITPTHYHTNKEKKTKKQLFIILTIILYVITFSVVTNAAETIFWGFDNENLSSSMRPNFSWNSNGIMTSKNLNTTDPFITYSCSLQADDYDKVIIRMNYDLTAREDGKDAVCQVYYSGTDASGNNIALSEGNSVKVNLESLSTNGEFRTYTLPLNKSNLKGATIKSMRFDIVNCKGSFGIDYIMIVPKNPYPDMFFGFDANGYSEGWGYANLTSAHQVKNGILTGTNKADNGLIDKSFGKVIYGGDYPNVYVRMKTNGISDNTRSALFYTDLVDVNGNKLKSSWWETYDGYKYASVSHNASNDGKWVVHNFNYSKHQAYMQNYFTYSVLNCINQAGPSFDIDYILYKNAKSYEWTFDNEGLSEGWTVPSGFKLENGNIIFTGGDTYSNPYFHYNNASIDASNYDGIEIIMKHALKPNKPGESTPESSSVQLYYYGTAADGSAITWAEGNSAKATISRTSGESYVRYYIDLTAKNTWKGATITSLRIDPINDNGEAFIDYIRLVPGKDLGSKPIDISKITCKYNFEDGIAGNADGTFSLDIGEGNKFNDIKKLTLYWADANGTPLSDYTAIRAFTDGEFNGSYVIDKNMLIPEKAKKIAIEIKDNTAINTIYIDIPVEKQAETLGEPLYTAAFISDIHIGGWGSVTSPNPRLIAARDKIGEIADFAVINGDLTQWYGAYSEEEFKAFNYNGSSFTDNGETDTSILDKKLGTSQWTVLRAYFDSFTVPVYPVTGNHDIRDSDNWNTYYYQPHYWNDFFKGWLEHSNNDNSAHKYQNPVTYHMDNNYYDAEIFGNHFIFLEMPKIKSPQFYFGEQQLAWLDKKLYEKEQTGKPIFVFTHVPTESNVNASYWDNQIKDDSDLKKILAKHPTATVISGHTHYSLDIDAYSSWDGRQNEFSVIHNGGTTTINVPNGTDYNDTTEITGSHGIFAEVYTDRILLRGMDFVTGKWISKGYTLLTLKDAPDFVAEAERSTDSYGHTVLTVKNPQAYLEYTWHVDGAVENGNSVTLNGNEDYVVLRATDENGVFTSTLYDNISDIPESTSKMLFIDGDNICLSTSNETKKLVVASYNGTRLVDVKILDVSGNTKISIEETGLDVSGCNKINAFLINKFIFSPITESCSADI